MMSVYSQKDRPHPQRHSAARYKTKGQDVSELHRGKYLRPMQRSASSRREREWGKSAWVSWCDGEAGRTLTGWIESQDWA